jgi:hypothetical protein
MDAVEGEDDHHDEIGDEQRGVEGVPAVGAVEKTGARSLAGKLFRELDERVLGAEKEREGLEKCEQSWLLESCGGISILRERRADGAGQ